MEFVNEFIDQDTANALDVAARRFGHPHRGSWVDAMISAVLRDGLDSLGDAGRAALLQMDWVDGEPPIAVTNCVLEIIECGARLVRDCDDGLSKVEYADIFYDDCLGTMRPKLQKVLLAAARTNDN